MKYVVTAEEMKRYENNMIENIGLPSLVLMEQAALATVKVLMSGDFCLSKILVVCGGGNNGADGIAAARLLHLKSFDVTVLLASHGNISEDNVKQMSIAKKLGVHFCADADFRNYTVIVDALFGIGLNRAIDGFFADLIENINSSDVPVLSVDIPSGLLSSGISNSISNPVIHAKKTVTFGFNKRGLLIYPGADYAGEVSVADIGISDKSFYPSSPPSAFIYDASDLKLVPARKAWSHKGSYGKVLVAAGSVGMIGAAYFSASAAYRAGVGLVKLLSAEENVPLLQTMLPEAIVFTENKLSDELKQIDAIVFGPGSGFAADAVHILEYILANLDVHQTLVIDGDGLTLLSKRLELLKERRGNIILTPHIGEMSRLTGLDSAQISSDLIGTAERFAAEHNVTCVLKDSRSVTASDDGGICINTSGNNGMATAGSGDVLTGIIAALSAEGLAPFEAASLGAYVHGLSGDKAAQEVGFYSLMARDIIDGISEVLRGGV